MKVERLKNIPSESDGVAEILRQLKPGECVRLKTAQEYRSAFGNVSRLSKELCVRFGSINDGDGDVLVYIKDEKPKKSS